MSASVTGAVKRALRGCTSARSHARLLQSLLAASSLIDARLADAQATSDQTPPASQELTTVTITGSLRPQDQTSATGLALSLVDTPQAISVVTPAELALTGAPTIYGATDLVPSLVSNGQGYGLDRITLRGSQATEQRINNILFNGFHSPDDYVLERIEIVRGPATALYGTSGNFGGEINNILKTPQFQFHSELGYQIGEFEQPEIWALRQYQYDVTGTIPDTGDHIAGRLVGDYRDYGAPIDVVGIHSRDNVVMGALLFQFTDATSSRLWVYYSDTNEDPYDGGFMQILPNKALTVPDVPPSHWYYSDPRFSMNHVSEFLEMADIQHKFGNDWVLKAVETVVSAERHIQEYFPFGPAGAYGLPNNEVLFFSYQQANWGKSLTLDISLDGKFNLFDREAEFFAQFEGNHSLVPYENLINNSVSLGPISIYQGGLGVLANGQPVPLVNPSAQPVRLLSTEGNADYRESLQLLTHPLPKTTLLLGALVDHAIYWQDSYVQADKAENPPAQLGESFTKVLTRAGITYGLLEDSGPVDALKPYYSFSEGFQPQPLGEYNPQGQLVTTPQQVTQNELGIKGEFLHHALGITLDAYDAKITNVPYSVPTPNNVVTAATLLGGSSHIQGVEFETVGQVVRGFNVAANYAYTNTSEANPDFNFTIPVPNVPRHKGALFLTYEIQDGPARGFRYGASVVSESKYSFAPSWQAVVAYGGYSGQANTRVGLNFSYRLPWLPSLEFHGVWNNIFNKLVYNMKENSYGFAITREDPDQILLGVKWNFK